MKRRSFLKTAIAAVGGSALGASGAMQAAEKDRDAEIKRQAAMIADQADLRTMYTHFRLYDITSDSMIDVPLDSVGFAEFEVFRHTGKLVRI